MRLRWIILIMCPLTCAMGYLSEVKIIFAEQKYDIMEELLEIRKDMSMKRTSRNEEDR